MESPNVKGSVLSTDQPSPIWKSSTLVAELLSPILKVSILIDGSPQVLPCDQHRSYLLKDSSSPATTKMSSGTPRCETIDFCCKPECRCKDLDKELVPDAQTTGSRCCAPYQGRIPAANLVFDAILNAQSSKTASSARKSQLSNIDCPQAHQDCTTGPNGLELESAFLLPSIDARQHSSSSHQSHRN